MDRASALIVVHFFAAGILILLQQQAARRRFDRLLFTYVVALTTAVLVLPLVATWVAQKPEFREAIRPEQVRLGLVLTGSFIALGGAYAIRTYANLNAQGTLPSYIFAPLSRSSLVIVVVVSMLFLGERRTPLEIAAVIVAFVPMAFLTRGSSSGSNRDRRIRSGIIWTLIGAMFTAGLQIASKVFVDPRFGLTVVAVVFVFGVNAGNMIVSAFMRMVSPRPLVQTSDTIVWGVAAGIANVVTFLSLTVYLVHGDASKIYPVSALSFIVPTTVLVLAGREARPSRLQGVSLALSLAAITILVS